MTNSDNAGNLVSEILRSISAVYDWTVLKARGVTVIELSDEIMGRYTGDFRLSNYPDIPFIVSLQGDRLLVYSSEGKWTLTPTSETEFVDMESGLTVCFVKGPDGRINQIKVMGMVLNRK